MTFKKLCADLDSYIYRYRAWRPTPQDPPMLTLSKEQKEAAYEHLEKRGVLPGFEVRNKKLMSYHGIPVRQ